MYRASYLITMCGLLLMAMFHPEPRFQIALLFLLIANALFLWV
jgi:hypothetical protein